MNNTSAIGVLRIALLYGLALSINLEEVLDVLFSVQTSLKPYRLLSIAFIMVSFAISGWHSIRPRREDYWLIILFMWGSAVVITRFWFADVSMDNFLNNFFLISISFMMYLSIANLGLTKRQVVLTILFYNAGLLLNLLLLLTDKSLNPSYGELLFRGTGFFSNPNSLAFSSMFGILGLIYIIFSRPGLLLLVLCVGLFGMDLYLFNVSGSRGGFYTLGLLSAFFFFWALRFKTGWALLWVIPIFVGLTYYVKNNDITVYALAREKSKEARKDENIRRALILAGLDAFLESDLAGLGIGQFQYIVNFYPLVSRHSQGVARERLDKDEGLVTHSTYVQLLAEYGVVGFVCFMLFWFYRVKLIFSTFWQFDPLNFFKAGIALIVLFYSIGHVILMTPHFWFFLSFLRPHVNYRTQS